MSDPFDNSDWQPGMPLPSRKETHSKKKKSKEAKQEPVAPQPQQPQLEEPRVAVQQESAAAVGLVGDVTAEERDWLLGENDDEDGSILTIWQRLLLFVAVPLVLLGVLIWGKIAYVHQVPDLVRDNVPAYSSGEGFLVLKPWWFGPPIYQLDSYPQANDFKMYQIRMGDHAPLVEDPYVLWTFPEDILK